MRLVHDSTVRRITIVSDNDRQVRTVVTALEQIGIAAGIAGQPAPAIPAELTQPAVGAEPLVGESIDGGSTAKDHVFVAMPFAPEFEDVYEFGIYAPVRKAGLACERVDQASFTGDILAKIKERISTARFVIAELTGARPNVYLEVGYSWGKDVPVVFLARRDEQLHFDVRTQKCIVYASIGQLARELERLITGLLPPGAPARTSSREWLAELGRVIGPKRHLLRQRDGAAVLDLPLSLDAAIADPIVDSVRGMAPDTIRGMVLHLRNEGTPSSTGFREMIRLWLDLNAAGCRTVVVGPTPDDAGIRSLLAKLIRSSDLYLTEDAALEDLRKSR